MTQKKSFFVQRVNNIAIKLGMNKLKLQFVAFYNGNTILFYLRDIILHDLWEQSPHNIWN